ncbi:MAG: DNA repair protein RecO [Syntrophomonadaceae bacterium]|nr:DNA repair protein RecO [Syntrophomonadaceae bacterium]
MNYRSRAIILKTIDYRDADKLVTLFSEKHGKVRAVARGVKKPASSLRVCLQPFCHSNLYLSGGKELENVTQGKLIDFFPNIREDIDLTLQVLYLMELLDKSLMDHMALPSLYSVTLTVLEYLNTHGNNPLAIRYFEANLLKYLGYQPLLERCVNCGTQSGKLQSFNLVRGGVICPECSKTLTSDFDFSGEALSILRLISSRDVNTMHRIKASQAALKNLEFFLEKNLEYHLERRFNMKKTIRTLKYL